MARLCWYFPQISRLTSSSPCARKDQMHILHRTIICHGMGHPAAIVPYTGNSPEEIANRFQEHIRRNHPESLKPGFFTKLLRPFVVDRIIAAKQLHSLISTALEPFPIISGLPTIEGQECVQCGYCGSEATVTRHLHNHASPTIPQTLQQIEVNGAYVVVRKPDQFQYKTDAWKALDNIMLDTHSTDLSGQHTESAFVKNTGWMGCVNLNISSKDPS